MVEIAISIFIVCAGAAVIMYGVGFVIRAVKSF